VAAGRKRKRMERFWRWPWRAARLRKRAARESRRLLWRDGVRRLSDPAFRAQVNDVRAEIVRRSTDNGHGGGPAGGQNALTLQDSAASESVRLGAGPHRRSSWAANCARNRRPTARIAALEGKLETLLGGAARLADA